MTSSSTIYKNILLNLTKNNQTLSTPLSSPEIQVFDNKPRMQYKNHPNSDKLAIIIDPRFDPLMEGVINNFMYFMNPLGWNLLIISYSGYAKQIKNIFPFATVKSIDDKFINLKDNIPNISIDTYNLILLDVNFWKSIISRKGGVEDGTETRNSGNDEGVERVCRKGEVEDENEVYKTVCIFQKDCIMYKMFPEYFINYDFSGANYYKKEHCGFIYGGINGGFSIRNCNAMIECLEKIDWEKIVEYRKEMLLKYINEPFITPSLDTKNEDVFFTIACEMLHKEVPDKIHRTFLSIEADLNYDTCVYHGWHHNYHDVDKAIQILKKSELFSIFFNKKPIYSCNNAD